MLVVQEQHAAGAQRRRDAAGPRVERAQAPERAVAEVDEIPASEQQLGRQRVDVGVHPRQLGLAPPRRLDRGLVVVDAGDERAQLGQVERLPARAAEEVEDAVAARSVQPLPDPLRHPRRGEDVLGGAVRVVEGAAVVVGGLHATLVKREAAVDDQRLAADHLRLGRAEEGDGLGDVLGLHQPPRRVARTHARASPRGSGSARARPVSTTPPDTALTRIPSGASSTAR